MWRTIGRTAAAGAGVLALTLGGVVPAEANNPQQIGNASQGTYKDLNFLDASNDVQGAWTRANSAAAGRGVLNAFVNTGNLPDYQGHKTCARVALDWDTPAASLDHHYDYRSWSNCDPNSNWDPASFTEPNGTCTTGAPYSEPYTCDMPMKRVKIFRYSPWYADPDHGGDGIISGECWDFGTDWCNGWTPQCGATDPNPNNCTVWVKHEDGTVDKYGNTDAIHTTTTTV